MQRSRVSLYVVCVILGLVLGSGYSPVVAQEGDFTPHLIGAVPFTVGYRVCVENDVAYVTGNDGIEMINVYDPYAAVWVGRVFLPEIALAVAVRDDIAYIGADGNGFLIVNVTDPAHPEMLQEHSSVGFVVSVCVDGDYAYVGTRDGDLLVFDISDLAATVVCGQIEAVGGDRLGPMTVKQGYLFLADSTSGVHIVNITVPDAPEVITEISQTHGAHDVMIHEDFLFIARHRYGIRMYDVSIPYAPQVLGEFNDNDADGGEAQGIWGDAELVYIADNYHVEALNITTPSAIAEVGEYNPISAAHDLTVHEGFVYVAAGSGLYILAFGGTHPMNPLAVLPYLILIIIIAVVVFLVFLFRARRVQATPQREEQAPKGL